MFFILIKFERESLLNAANHSKDLILRLFELNFHLYSAYIYIYIYRCTYILHICILCIYICTYT